MPRPFLSQCATTADYQAAFDAWHDKLFALSRKVDTIVEEQYGWFDGGDLCYSLMDQGTIPEDATAEQAARITAQHLEQA